MILCLTATMERLDGKEYLIKEYAPVCDVITFEEAEKNGWVSPVKNYCIMLDVDLTDYKEYDRKFNSFFAFFGFDFNSAMLCATNKVYRARFAKATNQPLNVVTANAMGFMKAMRNRKTFVMSHPKKFEIAKKIIAARSNKKIITFSATIKDAESIGTGFVLHSKKSKKQNEEIIEQFNKCSSGVLNSSKACDAGVDVKGLSVGIVLSTDSSKTRRVQRTGRVCRFEKDKQAEMFTVIINHTQELNWFKNANANSSVIYLTESQLDEVLQGKAVGKAKIVNEGNLKYRY